VTFFDDQKFLFWDSEFFNVNEPVVNPVCAAFEFRGKGALQHIAPRWWTHENEDSKRFLRTYLTDLSREYVFAAYSVEAECRFLHAIGVDYRKVRWIDLWVEYKHLLNKNNKLAYGKQLIRGKPRQTKPPPRKIKEWEIQDTSVEEEAGIHFKAETGLAACTYKLLDQIRDTDHKKAMRNLIIQGGPFSEEEKGAILDYCEEDTVLLPDIFSRMLEEYQELGKELDETFFREMLWRGEYAMRSAQMTILGYPCDLRRTRNLANNIPHLLNAMAVDVNKLMFPVTGFNWFTFKKKDLSFAMNQKDISDWLLANRPGWPTSDNGRAKLDSETLEQYSDARHAYDATVEDQLLRIQKTRSALRGFEKHREVGKKGFMDYVGSDGRVRPFFGIYTAQSSRSQPQATGFLFLKSAWLRCLVTPNAASYLFGIDFGSQEFLIAALLSGDEAMIQDYLSGDPYVAFGIRAGIIPEGGTKQTHALEREICKALILGTLYGLGRRNMALKISNDAKVSCSEEQAGSYITLFKRSYPRYILWRQDVLAEYDIRKVLTLADGWCMWGDNDNPLSVMNCPVQGTGAVVMRYAVKIAQEKEVNVIKTLHDALYGEALMDNFLALERMWDSMLEAWVFVMRHATGRDDIPMIRLEADAWSRGFAEEGKFHTPKGYLVTVTHDYIDKRAKEEYKLYEKYLNRSLDDLEFW